MDNNWVVDNLQNAFTTWNTKMEELWGLLTQSPETFKGGTIWNTIVTINGGMQAIGYGLLVLFFAISLFRSAASFRDFQRPEYVVRHLIQFVLAKVAICFPMGFINHQVKDYNVSLTALEAMDRPCLDEVQFLFPNRTLIFFLY